MQTVEIKAFLPAKDFELSKRFYIDLGFTVASDSGDLAYLHAGSSSFLLTNYYKKEFAENLMMHLLVEDVEAWWRQTEVMQLATKYGVGIGMPEDRPWCIRDFTLTDPSGVLWRIGQNIGPAEHARADAGNFALDL